MGRPRKLLSGEEVTKLAALGATHAEIADFFGVERSTITRRFSQEIAKGRATMRLKLRRLQFRAAERGNVVMQIFLGKSLLSQSEARSQELDHPPPQLSPEEFEMKMK